MQNTDRSLKTKLQHIKQLLTQKNLPAAEHEFVLLINEASPEWTEFCTSPNITKIFHYVRSVRIISGSDVYVNLLSQEVSFGEQFLLKDVQSLADLLFVMYHERNHVLVNRLYRSALYILLADMQRNHPTVPIRQLASDAEEVFVNALAHVVIPNQRLLETIFPRTGYVSLRTPHPDLNFWGQHTNIISMHQKLFSGQLTNCSFLEWVQTYILEIIANKTQIDLEIVDPIHDRGNGGGGVTGGRDGKNSSGGGISRKGGKGDRLRQKDFPIDPSSPEGMLLVDTSVSSIQELGVYDMTETEKVTVTHTFQKVFSTYAAATLNSYYVGRTPTAPARISRKDHSLLCQGTIPTMFTRKVYPVVPLPKFYIYFDVSGSMNHFLAMLSLIHKRLAFLTNPEQCFCFSTKIVPADPTFRVFHTTGGTSFCEVAKHLIEQKVTHAVVVSDGCDYLSEDEVLSLKKQVTHLIYVHVGRGELLTSPWHTLGRQVRTYQSIQVAAKG